MSQSFSAGRRVCFISARCGWIVDEGKVLMDHANGALVQALAARKSWNLSLAIIGAAGPDRSFDCEVTVAKSYAFPRPFSYFGGVVNAFRFASIIRKICRENDVVIAQLPFIGFISLLLINKPVVYHLCANVLTAAANPVKYSGLKRYVSVLFARFIHLIHRRLFRRRHVRVLANGRELAALYAKYGPTAIISSSISSEDILQDNDVAVFHPHTIRLLFVGRPSLEKGFDTLLEAIMNIQIDMRLTVVGFTESEFKEMLPSVFTDTQKIHDKIKFRGPLTWHGGLRDEARSHDIAVVPSRSEGTPRVILECMSQGVAVIASRVGGIPTIVDDLVNGVLTEPGNAKDLQQKVEYLANNPDFRKKLILRGLETARRNTIEMFAGHFEKAIVDLTE
jgi:glycosyltransferase involved in cell wall biosynthesis